MTPGPTSKAAGIPEVAQDDRQFDLLDGAALSVDPLLPGAALVAVGAMVAGALSGRPSIAGLGLAVLVLPLVALAWARRSALTVNVALDPTQVLEGDELRLHLVVRGEGRLTLRIAASPGLAAERVIGILGPDEGPAPGPGPGEARAGVSQAGGDRPDSDEPSTAVPDPRGGQPLSLHLRLSGRRASLGREGIEGQEAIEGSGDTRPERDIGAGDTRAERYIDVIYRAVGLGPGAVGPIEVELRDPLGLLRRRGLLRHRKVVQVRPRLAPLRSLPVALRLRRTPGTHLSRRVGPGLEPAEPRPFAQGDDARRIDWKVTARLGQPWLRERHPEQAQEVLLFLDSATTDGAALTAAVRTVARLASAYLAAHDRVGLLAAGGRVATVLPGSGTATLERIVARLVDLRPFVGPSEPGPTTAGRVRRIAARGALIVAVSTDVGAAFSLAVAELRRNGLDVRLLGLRPAAIELATTPGGRVLRLERAARLRQLARAGVPVTDLPARLEPAAVELAGTLLATDAPAFHGPLR